MVSIFNFLSLRCFNTILYEKKFTPDSCVSFKYYLCFACIWRLYCASLHCLTRCVDIFLLIFSHMHLLCQELPSFWNVHTLSTAAIKASGQIGWKWTSLSSDHQDHCPTEEPPQDCDVLTFCSVQLERCSISGRR